MNIANITYTHEVLKPEIIGMTINNLYVFKYIGYIHYPRQNKRHCFLGKCECGNEVRLTLINSQTKKMQGVCDCKSRSHANLFYQKFGRLTVVDYAGFYKGRHYWLCNCQCGNSSKIWQRSLVDGDTNSCGCLHKEIIASYVKTCITHHDSLSVEFNTFRAIKYRCNNKNAQQYDLYGGRGIQCKFNSYEEFLAEVGRRPSNKHSIDRIDNNKDYEPGNVRWATTKEQANNRRTTIFLEYDNKNLPMTEWARLMQVTYTTFRAQYRKLGFDIEKTIKFYVKKKGLDYASLQG